jgi:hypothetical protein
VTRLTTTVIPVSSPWRRPDYGPKHVGEHTVNKQRIIRFKGICRLFINFTNRINARNTEHIKK